MKELTQRHLQTLKIVETQRFIDETVEEMHQLQILPSYPEDTNKYELFVKTVLKAANKYGLKTEKECYVYIMAWHIIGEQILEIEWLMDIVRDDEAFSKEKMEALQHATYEVLGDKEVNHGIRS